jgi:hypothetical protein
MRAQTFLPLLLVPHLPGVGSLPVLGGKNRRRWEGGGGQGALKRKLRGNPVEFGTWQESDILAQDTRLINIQFRHGGAVIKGGQKGLEGGNLAGGNLRSFSGGNQSVLRGRSMYLSLSHESDPLVWALRGWRDRGDLKAERRIISKRCIFEYIQLPIFRSSFKFCIGDKLREKMEGGKRDETFFSAL